MNPPPTYRLPVLDAPAAPDAAPALDEATPQGPYGREYWRSLEEKLGAQPEVEAAREFPPGASELNDPVARRDFVKLLGASLALAGVGSACTQTPAEKIVPYWRKPPELTPGNPLHFATTSVLFGYGVGLLVTSREGRPVKVEGNPEHPFSLGATGVLEQGLLLQLYDPHRARTVKRNGKPSSWRAFVEWLGPKLDAASEANGGAGVRFLVEPTSSPLLESLRAAVLRRLPNARFVSYAPASPFNRHEGAHQAFAAPMEPLYDFSRARVILSVDHDFLETRGPNIAYARAFADRRTPGPEMNRLYAVEPELSLTGTNADHRLRLRPSQLEPFLGAVVRALAPAYPEVLEPIAAALSRDEVLDDDARAFAAALAKDLQRAGENALVLVGDRLSPATHALAHALHAALGATGNTVKLVRPALDDLQTDEGSLRTLAEELESGQVETLVITSWNPVYASSADIELQALLRHAPACIYLGLFEDETAHALYSVSEPKRQTWVIPEAHLFESWGDARALDGTVSLVQPLVEPLFNGVSSPELYAAFAGQPDAKGYVLLKESWRARSGNPADFDHRFDQWLQVGVVPQSAAAVEQPSLSVEAVVRLVQQPGPLPLAGVELAFRPDSKVYDGRFANNAWLQELPDPVSKLTWDNAAYLSARTAARLGVETRDLVRITYRGKQRVAPVFVVPGHADETLSLPLGYGRERTIHEKVAREVGFDAYALRFSDAPWFASGATVEKVGGRHSLAVTQEHWSMENRPIALDAELGKLDAVLEKSVHPLNPLQHPVSTIQEPYDYSKEPYQWAMAVDMNRCTGCSACVVACQAENNIPVVGREGVERSREMHWLRVDRYFAGDLDRPDTVHQPMMCQHCETAPCEYVCPVNATVHSDEGLNEMVYNRCIGTRYCSNNCPYKVRRFNFFHYTKGVEGTTKLAMNPDVTVRARGVMEKCTYCVQRIEKRRIEARREGRRIRDGELQTACQQVCPTQAITFGSLNDPNAKVTLMHADRRRYDVLYELGTRPRTAYLIKVRNPNPELG